MADKIPHRRYTSTIEWPHDVCRLLREPGVEPMCHLHTRRNVRFPSPRIFPTHHAKKLGEEHAVSVMEHVLDITALLKLTGREAQKCAT